MKNRRRTPLLPAFEGSLVNPDAIHGMKTIQLTHEMREFIEGEALDIFTTCSNSGLPFRSALTAVFISGMNIANIVEG